MVQSDLVHLSVPITSLVLRMLGHRMPLFMMRIPFDLGLAFIVASDAAVSKPGKGSLPEDTVIFMFLAGKARETKKANADQCLPLYPKKPWDESVTRADQMIDIVQFRIPYAPRMRSFETNLRIQCDPSPSISR